MLEVNLKISKIFFINGTNLFVEEPKNENIDSRNEIKAYINLKLNMSLFQQFEKKLNKYDLIERSGWYDFQLSIKAPSLKKLKREIYEIRNNLSGILIETNTIIEG